MSWLFVFLFITLLRDLLLHLPSDTNNLVFMVSRIPDLINPNRLNEASNRY
jgi:hypothetical protein